MNIVLIGYRCTGKSSVGRILAERLGWNFVDTDEIIEEKEGKSIPEIVEEKGWEGFRRVEKEVVKEVSNLDNSVIATGGGVILNEENVCELTKKGWVVWLKARPETIKKRMLEDKTNIRPGLKGRDPLSEIEDVLRERNPIYEKSADFSIDTDTLSIDEVSEIILKRLRERYAR